jgi:hypothetical protein
MLIRKFRILSFICLLCPYTPAFAMAAENQEQGRFEGLYLGLTMNSIDMGINSRIQNHDTVLFNSGGIQPSLFYRGHFNPLLGSHIGYYFEYGMDRFTLRQGLVWDPGSSQDIDPGQSIQGWYGYAAPMLAYRSGGLTMAIGPALNIIQGNGGFAVSYWDNTLVYESFSISKLNVSFRLLIEGETKHFLWGMRMLSVNHQDSRFYYDIGFVVFYLGIRI